MTLEDWQAHDSESLFAELMNAGGFGVDNAMRDDGSCVASFMFTEGAGDFMIPFSEGATLHDILARLAYEAFTVGR